MLIKGEKYACDACVRGHRVSSCNHTDRPLIHINKKGRPVSQCPHCRGLRKARAQHVKCDCADKNHNKSDCKKDHTKGNGPSCCCAHGGRCTCALKKEHALTSVPDVLPPVLAASKNQRDGRRPPRLSTGSMMESKTTIFRNGHHKPVHKLNDIHNRVGAPYKVPARSRTITSHGDYSPRSTDIIPLTKEHLSSLQAPYSITSAPNVTRQVKSEHGSPTIGALPTPPMNHVPPISIPAYDVNNYMYNASPWSASSPVPSNASSPWDGGYPDTFPDSYFLSYDSANEMDSPISTGFGPESEIDWSTYNFQNNLHSSTPGLDIANRAGISSHPHSYASYDGFSHLSHPGMTSSSGDLSEVDDFVPITDRHNLRHSSQDLLNDFSSTAGDSPRPDPSTYRLSSASSYAGITPSHAIPHPAPSSHPSPVPQQDPLNTLQMDAYLKSAEAQSRETAMRNQRLQADQHQELAHFHSLLSTNTSNPGNLFTPPPEPAERPLSAPEPVTSAFIGGVGVGQAIGSPGVSSLPGNFVPGHGLEEGVDDGWVS